MAISSTVIEADCGLTDAMRVVPVSEVSKWATVIDAGGPAAQDNSGTITIPDTHISASTRHIFKRGKNRGTLLRLSLCYDPTLTSITDCVVKLFGRADSSDRWQLLRNKAGNITATLTTAATDAQTSVSSVNLARTTPNESDHTWDCDGCNEFIVGVVTALAGSTGVVTSSIIQFKII